MLKIITQKEKSKLYSECSDNRKPFFCIVKKITRASLEYDLMPTRCTMKDKPEKILIKTIGDYFDKMFAGKLVKENRNANSGGSYGGSSGIIYGLLLKDAINLAFLIQPLILNKKNREDYDIRWKRRQNEKNY